VLLVDRRQIGERLLFAAAIVSFWRQETTAVAAVVAERGGGGSVSIIDESAHARALAIACQF